MKKFKQLLLCSCISVFLLVGCGSTDTEPTNVSPDSSQTQATETKEEQKETPAPEKTVECQTEFETVHKYINALNDPEAVYVAEIKNTGTTTVKLSDISIDLEDSDGKILTTTDYVSAFPNVINPGESAYICESLLSYDTTVTNLDTIGKALVHYTLEESNTVEPLNVEITETQLTLEYSRPKIVGRIENMTEEAMSNIYIACPIYSANGELLTVTFTIVDSLNAHEKKGFDQTDLYGNPGSDYTNATFKTIPYLRTLF